jgi:hypothetical protein
MSDLSALKKRSRLGMLKGAAPPQPEAVRNNLEQPEHAPAEEVDGRTLKKTGRTHQLATRVTPEFYRRVRQLAAQDDLKIVELLERAIDAYEQAKSSR